MLARSVAEYNSSAGAASAGRGTQFLLTVRDGFGNDILDMARPSLPAYCAVGPHTSCLWTSCLWASRRCAIGAIPSASDQSSQLVGNSGIYPVKFTG